MGVLTQLAQAQNKVGDTAPYWKLLVNGRTYKTFSVEGEWGFGGSSKMSFSVDEPLTGLDDAVCKLFVGYGPPSNPVAVEYFTGLLSDPSGFHEGRAAVHGPFKIMADQFFGESVRYQGTKIGTFFMDLARRSGPRTGAMEVRSGDAYTIEDESFNEETNLIEAADSIAEPANFVFFDRPRYRRLAMPKPNPGATGSAFATYDRQHYPKGGFRVTSRRKGRYSKVVVFRRASSGPGAMGNGYDVRAPAPVPDRGKIKPLPGRIYYVPDFPGTQSMAQAEAARVALSLASNGEFDFELNGISINPELELYGQFVGVRLSQRPDGDYLEYYGCQIENAINFKIDRTTFDMSVRGRAILIREKKLRAPDLNIAAINSGIYVGQAVG